MNNRTVLSSSQNRECYASSNNEGRKCLRMIKCHETRADKCQRGDLVSSHKTYHDHFIHDWGRRLSAKSLRTRGSSLPVKGAEPRTPSWIIGSGFHNPLHIIPFLCVPILANSSLGPMIYSFDCRLPVIAVPHPIANCRQFSRDVIAGARGGLMPVIILIVTLRPLW